MDFYTFYNSKKGAISLQQGFRRGNLVIQAAKSLQPNLSPKDIQKGMKVYDWENSIWFSLDMREAKYLRRKIMELLKQGYVSDDNGNKVNQVDIPHFPDDNTVTRVYFRLYTPEGQNSTYYIFGVMKTTNVNGNKQSEKVELTLTPADIDVLFAWLDSIAMVRTLAEFGWIAGLFKTANNTNEVQQPVQSAKPQPTQQNQPSHPIAKDIQSLDFDFLS